MLFCIGLCLDNRSGFQHPVCGRSESIMETPPPIPSAPAPAVPRAPEMSLSARLLNIFAVPGDVFEEVKQSRVRTGNWLLPLLLTGLVAAISGIIIAMQPAIQQQKKELLEKGIEENVKAGRMSRQQADQYENFLGPIIRPPLSHILAGLGGILFGALKVFGWAFAMWLLGLSLLKARVSYMKLAEVAGLAAMIGVLGMIVTMLLQVNFSNLASSPSLAMTVKPDPKSPMFLVLQALNLFDIWQLCLMAAGLARLAGVPFMRAGFAVFGFWLVMMTGCITVFAALGRMFG
jgi:hypothetical protein